MIRFAAIFLALVLSQAASAQEAGPVSRTQIMRAQTAPTFDRIVVQLDIYRVLLAAGLPLSDAERLDMGELALVSGLPGEAEATMKPLFASGAGGGATDRLARRNIALFASAQAAAKEDRAQGLAASERNAAKDRTGRIYALTGEAWLGERDFVKAAELIAKGLAKGGMTPTDTALAQLHLGIAKYRSGRAADARTTWSAVRSDDGVETLAEIWIRLSETP